jgi:hypothetical protein
MNYFFTEVFLVGIYCAILAFFLSLLMNISLIFFFLLGFTKHILGFLLGIHDKYCTQGIACVEKREKREGLYRASATNLVGESILEGLWFLILGAIFLSICEKWRGNYRKYKENLLFFVFVMGGFTHILAEVFGLHDYFCEKNCLQVSK